MCVQLFARVQSGVLRERYIQSRRMYNLVDRPMPQGLFPLPETPERINMWLMNFAYPENDRYFNTFAALPDIQILKREKVFDLRNPHDCSWFVFHELPWYVSEGPQHNPLLERLFALHQPAIQFLQTKGYTQSDEPRVGHIVIYATNVYGLFPVTNSDFKVSHYGKVVEVREQGTVIVESKFGHAHTYRHRLDTIPYFLGNAYTFLAPPNSQNTEQK